MQRIYKYNQVYKQNPARMSSANEPTPFTHIQKNMPNKQQTAFFDSVDNG